MNPISDTLLTAIRTNRVVRFSYNGRIREVEPYTVGATRNRWQLLGFQIDGESTRPLPAWRSFLLTEITDLKILDKIFEPKPDAIGSANRFDFTLG